MNNTDKNLLKAANFRQRGKQPLYARLQNHLRGLIESGHWKPNERLPPERDLAETTGFSINTVKTALHNLVLEGYLVRRQGSGTYVASPDSFFGIHRYYAMQKDFGAPLERHKKDLLSRTKVHAPDYIARHFPFGDSPEIFRVERLLRIGGVKTVHTVSWLPVSLFTGLEALDDEVFQTTSLYSIMAEHFNYPCRTSKELLCVAYPNEAIAKHLELEQTTPLLYSKLIALSYLQHPVEIRESHIRTDSCLLYREF